MVVDCTAGKPQVASMCKSQASKRAAMCLYSTEDGHAAGASVDAANKQTINPKIITIVLNRETISQAATPYHLLVDLCKRAMRSRNLKSHRCFKDVKVKEGTSRMFGGKVLVIMT